MKQRFLGAFLALIVCLPPLIFGGWTLKIFLAVVVFLACYEFISIREKRFNLPIYLAMVTFVFALNLYDHRISGIILIYIITLFVMAILSAEISLDDISSALLMGIILAYAVRCVIYIYEHDSYLLMLYVAIASFGTDTGAYFIGRLFGKHPLNSRISPKKTMEGSLGGWLFGCVSSLFFAWCFHFFHLKPSLMLFLSFSLPLIAQVGDLSFSVIKRNYGVKDYGSIIPGHGGVLDRIDSLLFCLIFYGSMASVFGL